MQWSHILVFFPKIFLIWTSNISKSSQDLQTDTSRSCLDVRAYFSSSGSFLPAPPSRKSGSRGILQKCRFGQIVRPGSYCAGRLEPVHWGDHLWGVGLQGLHSLNKQMAHV